MLQSYVKLGIEMGREIDQNVVSKDYSWYPASNRFSCYTKAIMGKKGVLSFRNLSNLEIFFTSAPLQIIVENVIYILIIIFRACVNYNDFIVNLDFKKCICII